MNGILLQRIAESDASPPLLCMPAFVPVTAHEAACDVLRLDAEYAASADLHMVYLVRIPFPVAYNAAIERIMRCEKSAAMPQDAAYPPLTGKAPCF